MRKLYSFLLAASLLCVASPVFAIPEPTFSNMQKKEGVGFKLGEPVRIVRLVRNAENGQNGASIVSGDAVIFSAVSDDGVSVVLTTTSADGSFAGIAATTIQTSDSTSTATAFDDNGRRNWGWVVVYGKTTAKVSEGGTNGNGVGDPMITSKDSGAVTSLELAGGVAVFSGTNVSLDNSTIRREIKAGNANGGFFMDAAAATGTSVDVFVTLE